MNTRLSRMSLGLLAAASMFAVLAGAAPSAGPVAPATPIPPAPKPLEFPGPTLLPAGKEYLAASYGAVPDGTTLNTAAIQKAIDTCSAEGGGTVVLAKTDRGNTYLSGAIFLKKGVHLRVDKETMLKGSVNPGDYPIVDSRFEGIERPFMAGLVNATNLDGVSLCGEGTIDGSGNQYAGGRGGGRGGRGAGSQPATSQAAGTQGAPAPAASGPAATGPAVQITPAPPLQTVFTAPRTVLTPTPENPPALQLVGAGGNRPRLVLFTNCTNCAVKDVHLQNQAVWCLHILYCTDFLVENVDIKDLYRIASSDGIDIDSSRRVHVDKTTISANDDCISIKSGKDADGRRVNRACEEILITNSHMAAGQGGVAMGSEVSGTVRNVEVRDTVVDSGNWAPIRFKSNITRGGLVENIVYRNIKVANVRSLFDFNLEWSRAPSSGDRMPTTVRNVYVINVTGTASSGGAIHGLPDAPITNIVFKDCDLTANSPVRLSNTANLDLSGLKLTVPGGGPGYTVVNTPATEPAGTQTQPASMPATGRAP